MVLAECLGGKPDAEEVAVADVLGCGSSSGGVLKVRCSGPLDCCAVGGGWGGVTSTLFYCLGLFRTEVEVHGVSSRLWEEWRKPTLVFRRFFCTSGVGNSSSLLNGRSGFTSGGPSRSAVLRTSVGCSGIAAAYGESAPAGMSGGAGSLAASDSLN